MGHSDINSVGVGQEITQLWVKKLFWEKNSKKLFGKKKSFFSWWEI